MPVVFAGEKYFTVESRSGCVLSARHMTPALAKPAGGASAGPGTAGRGQRPSPARQWRPPSWPAPPSWCGSTSPRAGGRLAGPTHTTGSWWANPVPGWGTLARCHEFSGSVRRYCGEVLTCPPPCLSHTHHTQTHARTCTRPHIQRERGGGERHARSRCWHVAAVSVCGWPRGRHTFGVADHPQSNVNQSLSL